MITVSITVAIEQKYFYIYISYSQQVISCGLCYPESSWHAANIGLMLAHRLRRWSNIKLTLADIWLGHRTHGMCESVRGDIATGSRGHAFINTAPDKNNHILFVSHFLWELQSVLQS